MPAEQARLEKPVLADAVITVNNAGTCAPSAAVAAALRGTPMPDELKMMPGPSALLGMQAPARPEDPGHAGPGTLCLPGQICQPAQSCLPGWQCMPGTVPTPEPPAPPSG